jgi:hypothetical protein
MLDQRLLLFPCRCGRSKEVFSRLIEGIDKLSEDVELELIGCGVANAYRRGALVAG